MIIELSIIDQQLGKIQEEIRDQAQNEMNIKDPDRLKSLAFVYLCVKTMLDLDREEAFDCLTDGGNDFGVDALHLTEELDGEFVVTLFQGKYKNKLDGSANFPKNDVDKLISAIRFLFDPMTELGHLNDRLRAKVEITRSMIRDGLIPQVRVFACNNGLAWNADAEEAIQRTDYGNQVVWEHVNHQVLTRVMQAKRPVNETLRLVGKAIFEDMNYSRVCIGRIPVTEVAALMRAHGERLLERNIRRYLGFYGNRVNESIRHTLCSNQSSNFYFFNNGLTLVCNDFNYNGLQNSDYQVKVDNLQIVNGGQTCMTILKTLYLLESVNRALPNDASVLVRIYKLPRDREDIVLQITHATNSQNPVDLKDLKSNDSKQQHLETSIASLGFTYHRKRMDRATSATDISSGVAAEAILAVWRQAPHQANFLKREHFGKLYQGIFTDTLNGAQVILAVLLYRIAENHRRRPTPNDPIFVRYASCFLAMQMGKHLLNDLNLELQKVDHQVFANAKQLIEEKGQAYFEAAIVDVQNALADLYGSQDISLQQLAATFRRGDLISRLRR